MKTGNNTIHNLIQRLGVLFWVDITLLLWSMTSIASFFYVGNRDATVFIHIVDVSFTIFLSIPTLFLKDPDESKRPKSETLGRAWGVSKIMLFFFVAINTFRFDIQSALGFDSEFPLRASLLFILATLVFFTFQLYFLVKKIW